ncbi:3-oxo-5-alpha-steroid 4-dehydrogenase-like protein [Stipitochalara longipes BDJ]|nr:3-oxo-5-alpha-steroid 4-dehydrogenase-like protein [Stipitochalara longipes BDJ]
MDPALFCQIFYCLGTVIDVGGPLIPSFREYIMNYGSRSITSTESGSSRQSTLARLLKYVGSFQVPHTWFAHYYVLSVASSVFWAIQIFTQGAAFEFLASFSKSKPATTANQAFMAWLLMAIQGTRRLYECIAFVKPTQSKMWAGMWIIGMAFYVCMGISVWIESTASLQLTESRGILLQFSAPTAKTSLAILMFLVASGVQHDCHKYLASLQKYTLPNYFWFRWVVCPHYTSECLIYLAIAIASAPHGQTFNRTVLAGLGFVASNLAVTADSTRKWYSKKFGIKKVVGRWRMIPYVY